MTEPAKQITHTKRTHKELAEIGTLLFINHPHSSHEGEALVEKHGGTANWLLHSNNPAEALVIYPDKTVYRSDELEAICQIWLALRMYEGG